MHGHERLHRLFNDGFRALDIAEPLPSFDREHEATAARGILRNAEARVAGVRTAGLVNGYVLLDDLDSGRCGDRMRPFGPDQVLPEDAGLRRALTVLERYEHCFLATLGTVDAVVTRHDVEKPPARMWLFGVITLIESNLARTIADRFPGDAWHGRVSAGRLAKARALQEERRRRGQPAHLVDCLQLSDKALVLLRDPDAAAEVGFPSVRAAKAGVKQLETLRNQLAHTQEIVSHGWAAVPDIAARLDRVLRRAGPGIGDAGDEPELVERARAFAVEAHEAAGHRRKYTDEPYQVHLEAVARMVAETGTDSETVAAAWLHDTVEDTHVTRGAIERAFGPRVARLVDELTDVSGPDDGNRERRKAIDREHSANASPDAKTIKLADLIDNLRSIAGHDPRFARVYAAEMERLLPLLREGNGVLHRRATEELGRVRERLNRS
jgi:hypothetical protein